MGRCIDCPEGWRVYQGRCYQVVHDQFISWVDARKNCLSKGADLINIPEDEENFNNFWIPFVNAMGLVNAEGGPFIDYTYVSFLVF